MKYFPTIDLEATGRQIVRLRKEKGLTVRDMQNYFGFDAPQAIYKWQKGLTLPSVDNLFALSVLLEVPMDRILVRSDAKVNLVTVHEPNGSVFLCLLFTLPGFCAPHMRLTKAGRAGFHRPAAGLRVLCAS